MKWIDFILYKKKFKEQLMILFLPITIFVIILIGIFVFTYGMRQVKENSEYLMTNTTNQMAKSINNKLTFIFNQCNSLNNMTAVWRMVNNSFKEEKSKEEYEDILSLYERLQSIYFYSNDVIESIAFKTIYDNQLIIYNDMVYDKFDLNIDDYLVQNKNENYGFLWLNTHTDKVFPTKIPRDVVSLVLTFRNSNRENTGVAIFNMKSEYFRELLNEVQISQNGYAILLSKDGVLLPDKIQDEYMLNTEQIEIVREQIGTSGTIEMDTLQREKIYVYYSPLEVNNWLVVTIVPQEDLFDRVDSFRLLLIIMFVVCFFLLILISVFATNFISKPIEKLSEKVIEYQNNSNVDFNVIAGYEINTLADGLNRLKKAQEILIEQVKEEQKEVSNLELKILQAQIKPHFLYNTLTSIRHLIAMKDQARAEKMCTSLIQFYKIGLSDGKDIISIQEEFEHVENYLMIQKLRYENEFEFDIEIDDDIKNIRILRLSLQPIVENAIYHGIKLKNEPCIILINGKKRNNKLILTVYDDGIGIDETKVKMINKEIESDQGVNQQTNFGLKNVYSRLKILFGEDIRMCIKSSKGVYTQVTIELPIREKEMRITNNE